MRPAIFGHSWWWGSLVAIAAVWAGQAGCDRTPTRRPNDEGQGRTGRQAADAGSAADSAERRLGSGAIQLKEVTGDSGVRFRHTDGSSGQKFIPETVTAGLALFDYDNDGWIDVYFLNGAPLPPAQSSPPPTDALYRNEGGMRFEDVTALAGVGDTGFGMGVAVGDYDNDGHADIYVSNFGPNVLYRNNGDGTLTDVTQAAGVSRGEQVGAGTCFLDADKDGDLDLYVANYVDFRFETHFIRTIDGYPAYPSPLEFNPVPDVLYRNNGDGTFTDVSEESGIGKVAGNGMGTVCADIDNDGDTDIFVLNDVGENFLFLNDGSGRFEEEGLVRGLACNSEGHAQGSMGVDCADYDNDGQLDFFMTSYRAEWPVLYRNLGQGFFEDVTLRAGAGAGSFAHVKWGTAFADFDNDGDKDIYLACGHLQQNIEKWDPSTSYCVRNVLLMNTGDGKFVDVFGRQRRRDAAADSAAAG